MTKKTEGWILSCIEENEEGPKTKYIRFLVIKAWDKPHKISKCYTLINKYLPKHIDNTVVSLKTLMLLHTYFKKGPAQVFNLIEIDISPLDILQKIHFQWKDIYEKKSNNSKDKKRSPNFSQMIVNYSQFLIKKLKICNKRVDFFEGNYSFLPFFNNISDKSLKITSDFIEDLIALLSEIVSFNNLIFQNMSLWKLQISLAVTIIEEEYCLISLITHLIYVYKNYSNFLSKKFDKNKISQKILLLQTKFDNCFLEANSFFMKCSSMKKDFGEIRDLVPKLNLEALNYLKNVATFQKYDPKNFNIFKYLDYDKDICGIKIPISYGKTNKKFKTSELLSLEFL